MAFVSITALSFPSGAEAEIERRFTARKRAVDRAEGFQDFELLRPAFGEDRYFVVTRWDSREAYEAWSTARVAADHGDDQRRGMQVDKLGFEVVPLAEA
ncbi:antibiotic biosynthesis monooxygenase family protein [Microbacterium suwonense]|uniref:Antibiotic biosynthesis monooxygenase n=1 Tax=Microbacterium suwonense TaxID=683047 RepID=A0ABN6X635_9MICO|nr:antibiotic biosynthesis monooxygenase [Microbacterium suwonense]BDZ39528.1 antibiotic biosynthesis monooxygenase [Microbacterium suwonense]